jgi:hypothetical protein
MDAPNRFIVLESFKHHRPEYVREIANRYGFVRRKGDGTYKVEIWVKEEGGGCFIIRLDTQGHTRFYQRGRPHYHKDWVPLELLATYLKRYVRETYVYSDDGVLLGMSEDLKHPDHLAKAAHIPR